MSDLEKAELRIEDDCVYDVLVAGGGPGGTAAAFRARELGLSVLVVEYDDLMKRIRDYSKDKLILPGFGGGDAMCFPLGGALIDRLRFAPIDKDDMCAVWKALHAEHEIPSRIGVELTGLDRRSDGTYAVRCWDHARRQEATFAARAVVVAIGRGVPRRFDIPGDTEGIAYRLDDPEVYVGQPACVIGGGTSAAEAVIAISDAKAAADDPTAVYWSYRGDRMPRVSRALADVFFEAYVGNGNIRYQPRSEPSAVIEGDDHRGYLSVRIDRRPISGRPIETTHLEFPKGSCIACIGEDVPERLLSDLGIPLAVGGPRHKRRVVVNRYLESARENVFLVGDILSQAYFETDDFTADPAGFVEVKHRGNIKTALRDGVLVSEVIRQRLDGKTVIDVRIEDADDLEEAASSSPVAVAERLITSGVLDRTAAPSPPGTEDPAGAFLVRFLRNGELGDEHPIPDRGAVTIGRSGCDLTFPDDPVLAPRHASVVCDEAGWTLCDEEAPQGVFLRMPVRSKRTLEAGDLICAGRQFLLVAAGEQGFEVVQYDTSGRELGRHGLPAGSSVLGRKGCDLVLDAEDRTLSRRHLALTVADGRLQIKDLKSANGTFLRVRQSVRLEHGDQFRVGQQQFTLSTRRDAVLDDGHEVSAALVVPPPAVAEAVARADGAPTVTFVGTGETVIAKPGQTICEVAEAHGVGLTAECHAGICGSDPIRIVSGHENLVSQAGDEEADTLEDLCGLKAGDCRLACMARIRGPVTVEVL